MALKIWQWTMATVSLCGSAAASTGADYEITCPKVIETRAVAFVGPEVPTGWRPYMPSSLSVETGFMMYGPPETMTYSKPDSSKKGRKTQTVTWNFSEVPESDKWLSCGYGAAHELTLSKALPRDVSICTVTSTKDNRGNVSGVSARCLPLRR